MITVVWLGSVTVGSDECPGALRCPLGEPCFAEAARREGAAGRVTVLVSHRFSTVRMADLIVVLDGSRVAEVGTHDDLMARDGQYASLFRIQAAAYRN